MHYGIFFLKLNLSPRATLPKRDLQKANPMATRARRASHAVSHPSTRSKRIARAAASPAAKAVYIAMATAGLAALAIGIFGPRRFQEEIVAPIRTGMSDQAERLWREARPLRRQIGGLIGRAADEGGREKLVRSFQSWIGHFRAT